MSISYKFVLDKRRVKPNSIYPLRLRVYTASGTKEKSLGIELRTKDWDETTQSILRTDVNFKANSYKLGIVKAKLDRRLLLAEDEEIELSAEDLIATLEKKKSVKTGANFNHYASSLIDDMLKAGRAGNAMAYTDALNSITAFAGNRQLRFEQISYTFLDKYSTQKLSEGVKVNSIAAYLRSIRAIYNKAIKADIVDPSKYPFSKFKIDTEDTASRKLTIAELKRIVAYNIPEGSPIWHNRNYFLLSFALIGINFGDLFTLKPSNIQNGNVAFQRRKTGRLYNFSIHPYAHELLDYYKQQVSKNNKQLIMPNLEWHLDPLTERKRIKQLCKNCSKYMKLIARECGITKSISTYYARYSWANIAKELGYSNDLIAEALGHEYGNNVTNIYLDNYDNKTINEANEKVMSAVFCN